MTDKTEDHDRDPNELNEHLKVTNFLSIYIACACAVCNSCTHIRMVYIHEEIVSFGHLNSSQLQGFANLHLRFTFAYDRERENFFTTKMHLY